MNDDNTLVTCTEWGYTASWPRPYTLIAKVHERCVRQGRADCWHRTQWWEANDG